MISIIIPVYNVEKYIHRCIDSILNQTFRDFELILVDDGSPDNCGAICDEYAAKDSRVRVIHKANGGQAAARNVGLDLAQGEWVLFCDSDDSYNQNILSDYLNEIHKKEHSVLNCFNFYNVWPNGIEESLKYPQAEVEMSQLTERITCLSSELSHKTMGYAVWDKLYSKRVIDQYQIRFPERNAMSNKDDWAEDLTFNLQYCMCVEQICVSEDPVYLLSKHGTPEEQNDKGLIGRLDHMMRIFLALERTDAYCQSPEICEEYWKIVIWHLRRYLYLDAGAKGVEKLRQESMKSPYWNQLLAWIQTALAHWSEIEDRWSTVDGKDYRFLLEYLVSGSMLTYKIKSFWHWRIRPEVQKMIRRK